MAHGVETTGPRGARFRSRLEARWAAFFSLCGYEWEYEPTVDVKGWIPDFALIGPARTMFIEVKPELSREALKPHFERIDKATGIRIPVWLVGGAFAIGQDQAGTPTVGWWRDQGWFATDWGKITRHLGGYAPMPFKDAQRLWVQAGNQLQWRRM